MTISPKRVFRFLASYGVTVVLLLLLSVLTFLGTLEQVDQGLYAVQKKYFESLFLVHGFFGVVPVPLPGAFLLMIFLAVNLTCGTILRAPKGWRHAGILLTHAGILVLLAGSFVTFKFSERGHITLYEGDVWDHFVSYDAWEIAMAPEGAGGPVTERIIPGKDFTHMGREDAVPFHAGDLPFDLVLRGYTPNARPVPAAAAKTPPDTVVDGYLLEDQDLAADAEQNIPGVYVTLAEKATETVHRGILWGAAKSPWTLDVGGQRWTLDLRRQVSSLPFAVRLDKFTRELYPGSNIPKAFKSDVTTIDGDIQQQIQISMNAPLRYKGYTLYQASWGPPNAGPGDRLYSSLAAVRNPAEQFPLYACCVICFGLLIHFCQKLVGYLHTEARKRS